MLTSGKQAFAPKGMHGYDPRADSMRAIFLAHGPAFTNNTGNLSGNFTNVQIYNIIARVLKLSPVSNNGSEFWLDRSGILKGN